MARERISRERLTRTFLEFFGELRNNSRAAVPGLGEYRNT